RSSPLGVPRSPAGPPAPHPRPRRPPLGGGPPPPLGPPSPCAPRGGPPPPPPRGPTPPVPRHEPPLPASPPGTALALLLDSNGTRADGSGGPDAGFHPPPSGPQALPGEGADTAAPAPPPPPVRAPRRHSTPRLA